MPRRNAPPGQRGPDAHTVLISSMQNTRKGQIETPTFSLYPLQGTLAHIIRLLPKGLHGGSLVLMAVQSHANNSLFSLSTHQIQQPVHLPEAFEFDTAINPLASLLEAPL